MLVVRETQGDDSHFSLHTVELSPRRKNTPPSSPSEAMLITVNPSLPGTAMPEEEHRQGRTECRPSCSLREDRGFVDSQHSHLISNDDVDEENNHIVSCRKSLCALYYLLKFLVMITTIALAISMTFDSDLTSIIFTAIFCVSMILNKYSVLIIYAFLLCIAKTLYMLLITVNPLSFHTYLMYRINIITTFLFVFSD